MSIIKSDFYDVFKHIIKMFKIASEFISSLYKSRTQKDLADVPNQHGISDVNIQAYDKVVNELNSTFKDDNRVEIIEHLDFILDRWDHIVALSKSDNYISERLRTLNDRSRQC